VELGGRNGNEAWVRSGLQAGQPVIVYPPPTIADGKRVRVRKP
jgi:HlyD family secretion protein